MILRTKLEDVVTAGVLTVKLDAAGIAVTGIRDTVSKSS